MKIQFLSEARDQRYTSVQWRDDKATEGGPTCVHPQDRNRRKTLNNFRNESFTRVFSRKKKNIDETAKDMEDRLEKNWKK